MRRRRAWPVLVVVVALSTLPACSDDQSAAPEVVRLGHEQLIAVCLTAQAPQGQPAPHKADLCTVDLSGRRMPIRTEVDTREAIALSTDRSRVAFVAEGTLRTIDVDGAGEMILGVRGFAPEWMTPSRLAFVSTKNHRRIESIDVVTRRVATLVDPDQLDRLPGSQIEAFAIDPASGRLVMALRNDGGTEVADDDQLTLAVIDDRGDQAVAVVGPASALIAQPDFAPDGRLVVVTDDGLELVDLDSRERHRLVVPDGVFATPVFSSDGRQLVWLGDGLEDAEGPAKLLLADMPGVELEDVRAIVGDRAQPFKSFPVFPDW